MPKLRSVSYFPYVSQTDQLVRHMRSAVWRNSDRRYRAVFHHPDCWSHYSTIIVLHWDNLRATRLDTLRYLASANRNINTLVSATRKRDSDSDYVASQIAWRRKALVSRIPRAMSGLCPAHYRFGLRLPRLLSNQWLSYLAAIERIIQLYHFHRGPESLRDTPCNV